MIKFDDVSKQFPLGNVALKNVSFEIKENEFVFFVGPSGAGKTTILKLILRQLIPSSGTLLVDDYDLSNDAFKDVEKLRTRIGVVFQDFKIMLDKNVFENIALSLKVLGASHQQIAEEIKEALNLVGLSSKTTVFPAQLSAGELQRVAIARAIVGDREIIIADEPTGNLDPKTAWDIMKIFKKLEGEKTILFATHNSDIVNSLRKRVIIMKDGKLVKDVKKGGYEE
ncbi:cell division ATP-binding protein FtsE [Candidatus Roizmanbacteria bacterium RIFCSPLOWO2_12_FULL_40_12]|uniref:Cell division ATP-binding protein FtsE n=1 Tax=Candidatus Roizmanbacteria bacterium RIFCSPLOWO2_01_FULL_40_42 TaxID=1802066 RepID=A0A1F7J3I8_9BACT|nr:MAG: cell division ATP-binding protein FtsE [Candidatus Roizmanbacteria bacterium RIFCSPHIGHO2_01_FULL_40_98]OGK28947.1 MAG: cell division ATP-binding protein FtsE [Candidatus Roizmanbacteria bacterium RIFCSPHIGHO2_02_FULL_40_53]OGK29587.1 MAG: cell division ATP-binding protein FtsE [Candidatus Roizmanbacteria bacterium RIFCSPHIGHO2_12_41_18]OGK36708.1 MAG: cell division ATP-binding protein FtsE [Candidatus Roizmanbacteria bacterium RIFCSPHIGHO2_12_FULL_40_130]OGK50176.1 MAG: cell division A